MAQQYKKNLTRPHKTKKKRDLSRGSVKLKSSLETYCYDQLKVAKVDFDYELETFQLMESFRYEGVYHKSTKGKDVLIDATDKVVLGIKYTPDFVSHAHKFVIETKGYVPSQHTFPLRWKLFLRYMNESGMGDYMLFIPKNRKQVDEAISIIKKHAHDSRKT
tara:strand:+ start:6972 stop:7457 length:486 start_codon:yes stop_codon:yes gene_type:complete